MRDYLTGMALAMALMQTTPALCDTFIAGLEPDRRPENAPAIKQFNQTEAWRAKALKGVTTPHPRNVTAFLKDQEAWFTPFLHPGLPGRYDLRGLHNSKSNP